MEGRNRYECAFAAWLRARGLLYVPVDESHRQAWVAQTVKSPDFIVYGPGRKSYVVDVKGRRYPGGTPDKPRRVWERWCTRQDCLGLLSWAEATGGEGALVFVYHISDRQNHRLPSWLDVWDWRQGLFGLCGIFVQEYIRAMRLRSAKWDTVSLPMEAFRSLAQPASVIFALRGRYELVSSGSVLSVAR